MYEINFAPNSSIERKIQNTRRKVVCFCIFIVLLLLYSNYQIQYKILLKLKKEKLRITEIKAIEDDGMASEKSKINYNNLISSKQNMMAINIENIIRQLPNNLFLEDILFYGGELNLKGSGSEYFAITAFSKALCNSHLYVNVRIITISYDKSLNKYSFLFKIKPRK